MVCPPSFIFLSIWSSFPIVSYRVMHQRPTYVYILTQSPNVVTLFPHLQQEALLWLFPFLKTSSIGPRPVLLISFARSLATPRNLSSQSQRIFGQEQRVFKLIVSWCSPRDSLEANHFTWTIYEHQEDKNSHPVPSRINCSFLSPNVPCSIWTLQTKLFYSGMPDIACRRRNAAQIDKSCGIRHRSGLLYWYFEEESC